MEDRRNNTDEDTRAPEVAERLARRHSEPPGLVDVSAPRRQYARTAGWVAQKFSLVNRVRDRYGVAAAPTAAQPSFVMRAPSRDAHDDADDAVRAPSAAPQRFAAPSAEQVAARAVMLPSRPTPDSTRTTGDDSSGTPTAAASDSATAPSDLHNNPAPGDARANTATPASGLRVRRASVRTAMHAGPNVLARAASAEGERRGTLETRAAGDASPDGETRSVPTFKAEASPSHAGDASRPELVMRRPSPETPESDSAKASESPAAPRDEGHGASGQSAMGVQSAATLSVEGEARASDALVMRSRDKASNARTSAGAGGTVVPGQQPLVKATGAASPLRAKTSDAGTGASSSPAVAAQTSPTGAEGEDGATSVPLMNGGGPHARVAATEINGGAGRADAGMVWRRTAGVAPERSDANAQTSGGSKPLMRQEDGSTSTTTTTSAAPVAAGRTDAGGIDVGEITEQVIRTISRRLAVERERRGLRK